MFVRINPQRIAELSDPNFNYLINACQTLSKTSREADFPADLQGRLYQLLRLAGSNPRSYSELRATASVVMMQRTFIQRIRAAIPVLA